MDKRIAEAIAKRLDALERRPVVNQSHTVVKGGISAAHVSGDDLVIVDSDGRKHVAGEVTGKQGPAGKDGRDGLDGKSGSPGRDGIDGQQGPRGPQGQKGIKGDKGDIGPAGKDGIHGREGKPGVSVIDAEIDNNQRLTLTLSNGNKIEAGETVDMSFVRNLEKKIKALKFGGGGSDDDIDVTVDNSGNVIYLKGNETTDGSLRMIPDTSFGTEFEFQIRENGVWNDTGILIAASTVYLGRELQVSAAGEYILTRDDSEEIRSLVPHVRFDPVTGTADEVVVPSVSALSSNVIIQSDDTGEVSGSTIQFIGVATDTLLANTLLLRTGVSSATGDVTVKLLRTSYTDGLFFQRSYPQTTFVADSDISLSTNGLVELIADEVFYISLECTGTLTLKADVTNTTPYFGGNFYTLTEDTVTPNQLGGSLSLAVVSDGDVVTSNGEIVWSVA